MAGSLRSLLVDQRTPVIVGAAEIVQRPEDESDLTLRRGPIELMADAVRAAAGDAGSPALATRADWIAVPGGWFRFDDPARLVAGQLGNDRTRTAFTFVSGDAPQMLVGVAAERIARGELDVAVVVGGEARWTRERLRRAELDTTMVAETGDQPEADDKLGVDPAVMVGEGQVIGRAPTTYAVFESALRAAAGEDHDAHRTRIARLWHGFNQVAVAHPQAWDRTSHSPDELRDPSPDNRMVAWPYTKAMVANNDVDMASAVVLCSVEVARSTGVATDRWVFPHVTTLSHDTYSTSERRSLGATPAVGVAGRTAFAHAGIGPDDVTHLDLYSCFPSIVQMSTEALGFSRERALTVTGGLGFAGAPIGNASGQAIAALVHRLRADPGTWGFVHANGGSATKHAFGVYSTEAPDEAFALIDCQDDIDLDPRPVDLEHEGDLTIEGATVPHGREGPDHLIVGGLTAAGARTWARSADPSDMAAAMESELVGTTARRRADGTLIL